MKKKIIKVLSVMLAVVLTLTAAPLSGFIGIEIPEWFDFSIMSKAATSGTCGNNLTWVLDSSTGTLTISGTGAMENYNGVLNQWNKDTSISEKIKNIVISDGVTTIGNGAFTSLKNLIDITIPDSVTSIGSDAFENCYSLTSITIPNSVTSIGTYAFSCSGLTSITIPDSITRIDNYTFNACRSLISITIPNSVTSINKLAFYDCTSLTSITIPNSVTTIGDSAFAGCTSLTSITIPGSITSISKNAFDGCTSLTSITIPNSVTSIGDYAFDGCTSLTNITIPKGVKSISGTAFDNCTSLTAFIVDSENMYYSSVDGVLFNKDKTSLIKYPMGNTKINYTIPYGVTLIGGYAFRKCDNLTNITIPDSVTSIAKCAFLGCSSVTTITIPDSVTSIAELAFKGCTSITSITIPNSITTINEEAFANLTSLTSIKIPDSVTRINNYAFMGCTSLTSITIPSSVTTIGRYAFSGCTRLSDVYYTGTEEEWNKISINNYNDNLLDATIHFNYCEHNFIDGTCISCGENKPIIQEMSPQIRFNRNDDGSYTNTFDIRTRAIISDKDFTELVGATNEEAVSNIDKIGFVYTLDGENFNVNSAQAVAQGETITGYVDAPVKYIQDKDGYYMFTCLVTGIPETDKDYTLTAYAYICVNGKWYFSEEPMNADFNSLHETYYPIACEKYGW